MGRARTRSKVPKRQEPEVPYGEAFVNAVLFGLVPLPWPRRRQRGSRGPRSRRGCRHELQRFRSSPPSPAGTPAQDTQDLNGRIGALGKCGLDCSA